MSSEEELSEAEKDHTDDLLNVRAFLKRASDEYKETGEKYALLSKEYEDGLLAAEGANAASQDQILDGIKRKERSLHSQLSELRQLLGILSYLTVVRQTLSGGNQVKLSVEDKDWQRFIHLLMNELDANLLQPLSKSSCVQLCKWFNKYADSWRDHASGHISSLIAGHLEQANIPQDPLHADKRLLDKIQSLAQPLLDISASDSGDTQPLTVVADALLRPFVKRFIHHFFDGQDRSEIKQAIKPEWYLSIIIKWHRQFTAWIGCLDLEGERANGFSDDESTAIRVIFARGLVNLARSRFKADLLHYAQDDPGALPHLIDEAISFDGDMKASGYPENEIGCVDVLTEPGVFELWAELEQREGAKCLDSFFSDPDAWLLRYGDNVSLLGDSDIDSHKVPLVTDNVLVLLLAMRHRFRFVRSQEHRRIFIQTQCALLHDFRDRLNELCQDLNSPISPAAVGKAKRPGSSPTFAHLVNTCSFVSAALTEWQDTPTYAAIRSGCFKDIIDLFDHFKRTLLRDACAAVLRDLQPPIDQYRRSFSLFTGRGDITFSGQATPHLYTPIQEALAILHQSLSRKNFLTFARQLAAGLDKMLIERVVLELRLDQKSGEELQRHLGATFAKVTFENYGLGAAAYFARLNEFLRLASMNAGNCTLLREALKERRLLTEQVMSEIGLEHITAQEAEDLLQRRSDLM